MTEPKATRERKCEAVVLVQVGTVPPMHGQPDEPQDVPDPALWEVVHKAKDVAAATKWMKDNGVPGGVYRVAQLWPAAQAVETMVPKRRLVPVQEAPDGEA